MDAKEFKKIANYFYHMGQRDGVRENVNITFENRFEEFKQNNTFKLAEMPSDFDMADATPASTPAPYASLKLGISGSLDSVRCCLGYIVTVSSP